MASLTLGNALQQFHRLFSDGTVTALSDEQLLARFVATKDEAAFEALVARHGPMVLNVCRSILKDEHAAEDAFQATFLVFAKKAHSLWARDTLGGWLHRVAYRIALHANDETRRRRLKEAAAVRSERDRAWDDWIPWLHDEIDRMPEAHRAPIVLCDLQELTYEQAAQQLRWTVPTLRCRLAKARERLRARLTRRGLTEAGATVALVVGSARANGAVPLASIQAATRLAMNGGATGTIAALAAGMLKGMRLARIKAVAGFVLALGTAACVAGAALAAGSGQGDNPPPKRSQPPVPPRSAPAQRAATPAREQDGEPLNYRGRVVGPDGQPIPGAKLFMVTSYDKDASSPARATAGPDGRFAFSVALSEFRDPIFARQARVTATAPGFGIGMSDWVKAWMAGSETPDAGRDLTIRLVEDQPIEGRVVDLEGRPVAGASVRLESLWCSPHEELGPWLAAMKAQESDRYTTQFKYIGIRFPLADRVAGAIPLTTTNAQGHFRISGIGRERLAQLQVEEPTIRVMEVEVLTRRCDPIQVKNHPRLAMAGSTTYYGASPRLVASPSRPIEGVVRDKQTGKPIAGVKINSYRFADTKVGNHTVLKTTSDAQGRYWIHGMPRGSGNELMAIAPREEPFLPILAKLDDPPGLETIHHDFELVRGTLIEGRITNLKTGAPVQASIRYHIARDNPNLEDSSSFRRLSLGEAYSAPTSTDADGEFRLTAVPGRGLISVEAMGMEEFPEMGTRVQSLRPKYVELQDIYYQAAIEIDVPTGITRQRLDIPLDPGLTREGHLVDLNGKPLNGAFAYGLGRLGGWTRQPLKDATLHVKALKRVDKQGHPGQIRLEEEEKITWSPRTLVFLHQERNLAGWIDVWGNETGPLHIRLQPSAAVSGRIIDAGGNPRVELTLSIEVVGKARLGGGTIAHLPERIRTDAEGRFRIEGLAPGLAYRAYAQAPPRQQANRTIDVAECAPGESRNLGDVTIKFQDQED